MTTSLVAQRRAPGGHRRPLEGLEAFPDTWTPWEGATGCRGGSGGLQDRPRGDACPPMVSELRPHFRLSPSCLQGAAESGTRHFHFLFLLLGTDGLSLKRGCRCGKRVVMETVPQGIGTQGRPLSCPGIKPHWAPRRGKVPVRGARPRGAGPAVRASPAGARVSCDPGAVQGAPVSSAVLHAPGCLSVGLGRGCRWPGRHDPHCSASVRGTHSRIHVSFFWPSENEFRGELLSQRWTHGDKASNCRTSRLLDGRGKVRHSEGHLPCPGSGQTKLFPPGLGRHR